MSGDPIVLHDGSLWFPSSGKGGQIIVDDPEAIAWWVTVTTTPRPVCCGHEMLSHGPRAANWYRCLHCSTDRELPS